MTDDNVLPEAGTIPRDTGLSSSEWKEKMDRRRETLLGATSDILTESDDAEGAARRLNRLYAPFNVYDSRGRKDQHLVVRATEDDELTFEYWDAGHEDPMDWRTLELDEHGNWSFDDAESPGDLDDPTNHHNTVAYNCLSLVWWGNEQMIARGASHMDE